MRQAILVIDPDERLSMRRKLINSVNEMRSGLSD